MNKEASLPDLYSPWLLAVAGGPIPAETKATCDRCAMLPSPGSPANSLYFHPTTKCCAFQPHIPNFLAGRLLNESDSSMAAGRTELEARIARRIGITPRWAGPGSVFDLLYKSTPGVFGRAPALRCQFLTPTGGCGIWKHRPAVCATWFCKYLRGQTGARFWKLADKLLQSVEQELSIWCLGKLGSAFDEILDPSSQPPDVSELGGEIDWPRYHRLWGSWAGREVEFYRACASLVEPLTWAQVEQNCGPRVRILAALVRDAYASLGSQAIPERLQIGQFSFTGAEGSGFRIVSYNHFDPLIMPERLARVLHRFDGRPTDEILETILVKDGVRIDPGLVRRMVDFGILKGCDSVDSALPVLQ